MKTYLKDILNSLPAVIKYLMIGGTVVFISFLIPEDLRFKYQFSENTIWKYEDYQAPFDFAVQKTEKEIQEIKQNALAQLIPFYNYQPEVYSKVSKELLQKMEEVASGDTDENWRSKLLDFLSQRYNQGVIQRQDTFQSDYINILKTNTVEKTNEQQLISIIDLRSQLQNYLSDLSINLTLQGETLQANLQYDQQMTENELDQILSKSSLVRGKVSEGEMIVRKGQVINEEIYQKLNTLKDKYEQNKSLGSKYWNVWIGYFLITSLCILIFILYLIKNSYEVFSNFAQFTFVLLLVLAFSWLVYYIEGLQILSVYLLPFCIVPIVIKNFFGQHIAFITFLFVVIISSLLSTYGYEFTIIQLLAGIVAIVADFNPKNWMSFFKSLSYIAGVYLLTYFTLNLIETGDMTLLDWRSGGWLLVSAFLNLLAYPFIPLFERIFGFTSSVRLGELADLERPLLKDLAIRAPGSFQHSLQVANLSEAAAKTIGANASLVRTAALYHDIGKMEQARYFIENSDGNNYHKELEPEESARIIIDHVVNGAKLARKKGLPSVITRFIRTHHGTTRVEYFYQKALNQNEYVDSTQFTYPGPKPVTKEETLLMVADSLEAAAKAIKDPSIEDLQNLLEKIVHSKINQGQFDESALSFEELEIVKESFLRTLKSIYHGRIKYPESKAE